MRKTAVFCLVVVVLLAGMTLPGVALQDGPPDHAEGEGDGPPDHANDGGGGSDGGDADGGGEDGDSDEADGENSDDDGDATNPPDTEDATDTEEVADTEDVTGDGDSDDNADDGPTATETAEPDDSEVSPTETVTELLPIDDEDDPIGGGDDSSQDETPADQQEETETSHDSEDPIPTISDDEETETPESERTPSGESGDGSGTEGSADSSDGDAEPTVEIRTNDSATVADVSGVEGGETVEVDLRGPATDGEAVALRSVEVRVAEGGPFTLTATRPTGEASGAAAPGVPVSYFDVGTDTGVEQATLTLEVEESALPAGVQPEDLEVLRQTDDGWETTETTYHEDEGVYTAETSGFSTFAVAAPSEGPLEVTDAEVSEKGGTAENATVVATVENTGDRQATETFAATVDGETVATRELTLESGESATVTFDVPADRAREGTVAVDGVEAGQLQVEGTENDSSPASSSSGNTVFGIGAAIFLVLSAIGTGLLAARHEDWDLEL